MNDEDYAIVVGINGYSALTPLKGAHADAQGFMDWLTSDNGGGLPDENVRIIQSPEGQVSDPADGKPTKNEIDRALRDFGLAINFNKIGRRLYFYFSGHGVGPDVDDVAMLMANATPRELGHNVGMGPYMNMLRRTGQFKEVVFILDCCRDAVKGVKGTEPVITLPDNPPIPVPNPPVENFVVLATNWGEKAFERPFTTKDMARLGVLTKTILKGMNDPAAANARGEITSETLRLYVIEQMAAISLETGVEQSPNFTRPSTNEIVFKKLLPNQIPKVTVRISAPSGSGHDGDIILSDNFFNEISQRPANQLTQNGSVWSEELDKRIYLVQYIPTGQSTGPIMKLDLRNEPSPHDFEFTSFN